MTDQPTGRHRDDGQEVHDADEHEVVRHEERADVHTEAQEAGRVRVRKHVSAYDVEQVVPRNVEHVEEGSERVPAEEGDSGEIETLPDGSVSIPVFEEVLVVTKKLVVRERVVIRKSTVVDEYTLRTELRREHVEIDAEGDVEGDVGGDGGGDGGVPEDRSHPSG